jgi:hypothetical protein
MRLKSSTNESAPTRREAKRSNNPDRYNAMKTGSVTSFGGAFDKKNTHKKALGIALSLAFHVRALRKIFLPCTPFLFALLGISQAEWRGLGRKGARRCFL